MTKVVQLHRMNASQASVYTGPIGEAIVDISAFTLRIQDGATPGGYRLMSASLNLNDVADKAAARTNLQVAPIDSPDFTTTASIAGATIATINGALGTPASANLSNCTNYDAVDLAGLGAGVGTLLGQASTGTGGLVGKNAPQFTGGIGITGTTISTAFSDGGNGSGLHSSNVGAGLDWVYGLSISGTGSQFNVTNTSAGVALLPGGTSWSSLCDETTKTKFKPFENALEKIASIKTGTGRYLDELESVSRSFLSAQDVQKVLPEAVDEYTGTTEQDMAHHGKLMVRQTDLVPLLCAALKEALQRIEILEGK